MVTLRELLINKTQVLKVTRPFADSYFITFAGYPIKMQLTFRIPMLCFLATDAQTSQR